MQNIRVLFGHQSSQQKPMQTGGGDAISSQERPGIQTDRLAVRQ